MGRVLFVCLHNAGRSQIARALFERAAAGRHEATSAGTTPAEGVHPEVVGAMRELGLDLSGRTSRLLTNDFVSWADVVVTMGCGGECLHVPGKRYVDRDLADPKRKATGRGPRDPGRDRPSRRRPRTGTEPAAPLTVGPGR